MVGADGIHSAVRAKLLGRAAGDFYRQHGGECWCQLTIYLGELAIPKAAGLVGSGKHFVHYLVSGGRYMNCVCVVETDTWQAELADGAGALLLN